MVVEYHERYIEDLRQARGKQARGKQARGLDHCQEKETSRCIIHVRQFDRTVALMESLQV